jgi:hypothetical protein
LGEDKSIKKKEDEVYLKVYGLRKKILLLILFIFDVGLQRINYLFVLMNNVDSLLLNTNQIYLPNNQNISKSGNMQS